jgi:ribosomal protein L37AE/L43A
MNTEAKYGKVIDRSHTLALINDTQEIHCAECDTAHEVEGLTDEYEYVSDRFNGSHLQTSSFAQVFSSVWECPTCQHINTTEEEI